ncbi:MAG: histidine kinase N-terminal 7TM domain-containing protein [Parcubacteria group bacterium]
MDEAFWSWVIIGMGILEFLLALWVFQKDPKSPIHWYFALVAFFLSAWTAINAIEVLVFPAPSMFLWDRLLFATVYAGSFFLFLFTQVYPTPRMSRWLAVGSTIILLGVLGLLLLSDSIIAAPYALNTANPQSLYPLYIAGFLFNWFVSIWLLFRSRRSVIGAIRQQINLLLIAIIAGSLLGMFESFVLPYFGGKDSNISQLWAPGVAFIIFIFSVKVLRMAFKNSEQR